MTEPRFVDHADPEEVFMLLSNDRRVRILQTLWEQEDYEASFSELRTAVGMRDSGQFSYHLDELVGQFVEKTADGYELTGTGKRINGTIEAGSFTMEGSIEQLPLDAPCPRCGSDRHLRYEDETVSVDCADCPVGYRVSVPPSVFAGYDREAIPRVASRYTRTTIHHITNGFCPLCDGAVAPTLEAVPRDRLEVGGGGEDGAGGAGEGTPGAQAGQVPADGDDGASADLPWIHYTCQQCGLEPTVGPSIAFIDHPAVVCFHYDRGVNVQERLVWDVADGDPAHQDIASRDPFRATVTYECDGDTLILTIAPDLSVVDIRRDGGRSA